MKVVIAGSRDTQNWTLQVVENAVYQTDWILEEVVCGQAPGIDTFGESWAKEQGIPVRYFPALWDMHGKSAGFVRNTQMAQYADALIAIWDGKSRGTYHMIGQMLNLKKPIYVYCPT